MNELKRAVSQSKALGVSLHVVFGLGASPDFATLVKTFNEVQPSITHWLIRGEPSDFELATKQLATISGTAKIGVTRVTNLLIVTANAVSNKRIRVLS